MSLSSNQKVAVVTTGGTIGSVLSDSVREVDTDSKPIVSRVSEHCDDLGVELKIVPAMNMLSENMEPTDWAEVGEEIQECVDAGYESIIVTHGTDTLVYSANAFRNATGDIDSRVVFTGSFYGPDAPNNDVEIALRSSLEASIEPSLSHGVYVSFRSPETDERAFLHRAVDTKPMRMDGMGFRSLFDSVVGEYTWDDGWNWVKSSSPTHNSDASGLGGVPSRDDYSKIMGTVKFHKAYPGQTFHDVSSETVPDVLVVGLYHSGTASLSSHSDGLRELIRKHSDTTEILLVGMSSQVVSPPYESTAKLLEEGARLVRDVQPPVIYTAMCVGLANGLTVDDILDKTPGVVMDYEQSTE